MKMPVPLSFDWNEGNQEKNWKKHKVGYKEAEEIFLNKTLKTFPDPKHSQAEQRYLALGATNQGRKLTIIFLIRNEKIRIISARDQSRKERMKYEKN